MKYVRVLLAIWCFMQLGYAHAALGFRTAVVDGVESDSATRPGYEGIMYVQQSGSWSGTPTCHASYAYINALDNPYFAAMILNARIHALPLRIYVDDSLPKVSGNICQIINLKF